MLKKLGPALSLFPLANFEPIPVSWHDGAFITLDYQLFKPSLIPVLPSFPGKAPEFARFGGKSRFFGLKGPGKGLTKVPARGEGKIVIARALLPDDHWPGRYRRRDREYTRFTRGDNSGIGVLRNYILVSMRM